jgi:hypothetical protein
MAEEYSMVFKRVFNRMFTPAAALSLAGVALMGAQGAAASETRGYAVNWFTVATIATKANCPKGLNPLSDDYYKRELKRLGHKDAEIEELMKDFPSGKYVPLVTMRGRIDGKPANIFANPWSQPDPGLFLVEGKDGFGFNLDGKNGPNDFVDPETKETGIDNGFWRAVGCTHNYHISAPEYANYPYAQWDGTRDTSGAWLLEISGVDDWKNDDNVTITIDKAIDAIHRDANGNTVRNMSFRVDPSSRSKTVTTGKIVNGELRSTSFDMHFVSDPAVMPEFKLKKAQMRINFKEDGSLFAYLGGYHEWMPIYWSMAQGGWTFEHSTGIDLPAQYYALKKLADFDPDPKTGENRMISGTWSFDAVPAYIVHPENVARAAQK